MDELIGGGRCRTVVLGERDVGKSTFCEGLLRHAAANGRPALLLDSDVGQKTIGPPACVTLGRVTEANPRELLSLEFVGTVSPVQGWRRLVDGVERLCRTAAAELLLVNTDGLLSGPGIQLKRDIIESAGADRLVLIGAHPDLDRIAEAHAAMPLMRLPPAPGAVRKSEAVRRANRHTAFQSYFSEAQERDLNVSAARIDGDPRLLALPRLLVGLADSRGDFAMGIVTGHDPASGAATVLTPAKIAKAAVLCLGRMQLDENLLGSIVRSADLKGGCA